jgi:hypothetical protein
LWASGRLSEGYYLKASMTRGGLVQAKICDFATPWLSRLR